MFKLPPCVGFLLILSIGLAGCHLGTGQTPARTPASGVVPATATSPAPTRTPSRLPTVTFPPAPTRTPAGTSTETPNVTATLTPPPTYVILRGQVLVRANCRYGPGAPYLYKYGLVPGSNLEVIGRNDLGTWILVRAIGGTNPCWVKASFLELKGDVMDVAPTSIPLPRSPYYRPLTGVSAIRDGDEVTISWTGVALRAGDETAEAPYLVETWLCEAGQLIFTPIGSYATAVTVRDQSGCSEASHGRVLLAEKHGYTRPIEIPWPPHE